MSSEPRNSQRSTFGTPTSWAHQSDLVMYARRVLGDRADLAEDVVQEAYLRLLALAAADETPESARPWLFRVVRNLAIDERRGAARRAAPVADPGEWGSALSDDTADIVERKEELAGALAGMAALPPKERRAVEMDQAGIGAQAIATELDTTPNAVHQALFRARRRLRSSKAAAWGMIPIGLVPFALKMSDPALAMTVTNLPPGVPMGRALPVAGLVAAAMVSGSVVAPNPGMHRGEREGIPALIGAEAEATAKARVSTVRTTQVSAARTTTTTSRPATAAKSGSTKSDATKKRGPSGDDDDDATKTDRRGTNRGSDDDTDSSSDRRRRSGSGSGDASRTRTSSDDDADDTHKGGDRRKATRTSTTPAAPQVDDSPDEPDDGDSSKTKTESRSGGGGDDSSDDTP